VRVFAGLPIARCSLFELRECFLAALVIIGGVARLAGQLQISCML